MYNNNHCILLYIYLLQFQNKCEMCSRILFRPLGSRHTTPAVYTAGADNMHGKHCSIASVDGHDTRHSFNACRLQSADHCRSILTPRGAILRHRVTQHDVLRRTSCVTSLMTGWEVCGIAKSLIHSRIGEQQSLNQSGTRIVAI